MTTRAVIRLKRFMDKCEDPSVVSDFCRLPLVSEDLADLVVESSATKEVAEYLAARPAVARALSAMSPKDLCEAVKFIERLRAH